MAIANNTTAQAYNRLQHSIDWEKASNESQVNVMEVMLKLLVQAPSHTPIFDNGAINLSTGERLYRSANDQYDYIRTRIQRLRRCAYPAGDKNGS